MNPGDDNPKDQLQASASANDAFGQIFDDESNTNESEEKPRSISLSKNKFRQAFSINDEQRSPSIDTSGAFDLGQVRESGELDDAHKTTVRMSKS